MTVYWHVDELKLSHVYPKEVTNFMEWIEEIYGERRIKRERYKNNSARHLISRL